MSPTLLVSSSPELQNTLHPITQDAIVDPTDPVEELRVLIEHLDDSATGVVIMDARSDAQRTVTLAGELTRWYPGVGVLLVTDTPAEIALPALRAGVHDILPSDAGLEEFQTAVDTAAQLGAGRQVADAPVELTTPQIPLNQGSGRPSGRVVTVVSPKGGVGKTTVSTNLAVGLARRVPNSTVIVDLDIQFGDVASALDLEPEHFLADAVRGAARHDSMVLKTFLTRHSSGLYAICAPNSPADADMITADEIGHLIRSLAAEFRYVVLDTAPGLSETTLAALDHTSDLILLTSMDVPGVRGLRKELDTLAALDMMIESRQVVLNFHDNKSLLSVADVEATIGAGIDLLLPRSKTTVTSVDQGIPLLAGDGRDPVAKQLRRLLDRLTAADPAVHTGKSKSTETMGSHAPVKAKARRAAARWRRTRQAVIS